MDCNFPFPNAHIAGLFRPDLRAPPAPASHVSSARPGRETLARRHLQSCAPSEYSKPHRSSLSAPPPLSLLFLTPLPAALAQSANPYWCGTASASSKALADRAPRSLRNSQRCHKIRTSGLAAAFPRTNETAAADSPCPAHETLAAHPVRTSSPAVPQFPPARRPQSPTAPPSLSAAVLPASRSLPSDCALLPLPDKDCCCA